MSLPERPLGDVLRVALDEQTLSTDADYSIAGVYGFGRGLFQRGPIRGSETSYAKLNRLRAGRLVMSRLKAFEGALAVIPPAFEGWYLSPEFPNFEIDGGQADSRYIANLCAWPPFWERLSAQSKGVGARKVRVNAARLMTVRLPLPDLPEQRRIAARLDAAFAKLGRVKELREHQSSISHAAVESAICAATSQHTMRVRLGSILTESRVTVEIDHDAEYHAFGMRSFGKGSIRYDPTLGSELSKLRYYKFPDSALVLSNIKAWEGAIGVTDVADTKCVASNRFLFYSARDNRVNISFLRHYLLSQSGLSLISRASLGSADRNRTLSINRFEAIEVPLPSREAQDRAAHFIDTMNAAISLSETNGTMDIMGSTLLNAAFTGQL